MKQDFFCLILISVTPPTLQPPQPANLPGVLPEVSVYPKLNVVNVSADDHYKEFANRRLPCPPNPPPLTCPTNPPLLSPTHPPTHPRGTVWVTWAKGKSVECNGKNKHVNSQQALMLDAESPQHWLRVKKKKRKKKKKSIMCTALQKCYGKIKDISCFVIASSVCDTSRHSFPSHLTFLELPVFM